MKVKEESEKVGLKLSIQKTKIMASASPHEPHLPGFPPVSLVTSWAPFAGSSAHPVNLNVLQNFILDLRFFTLLAVFLHDFILSFNCHPYVEDPYL